MQKLCLEVAGGRARILIHTELNGLVESLSHTFPRRYIPRYIIREQCPQGGQDAEVVWLEGEEFIVAGYVLNNEGPDTYVVSGPDPAPYVNESPVFFLLQVAARALIKKNMLVFTDTAALEVRGGAVLLAGYPHTGKSTLTALAYKRGVRVLSTENTVVAFEKSPVVIDGTSILVYDPEIKKLYDAQLTPDEATRHGYELIDLDKRQGPIRPAPVSKILILHSSFSSRGLSYSPVKGRKVKKTLWYFATGLIKGVDYYDPAPLVLSDLRTERKIAVMIDALSRTSGERMFEVYGSPLEILEAILEGRL